MHRSVEVYFRRKYEEGWRISGENGDYLPFQAMMDFVEAEIARTGIDLPPLTMEKDFNAA